MHPLWCLALVLVLAPTARCTQNFVTPWTLSDIIPSRMIGTHLDEEIHTARVRVGTPERELLLALDFSGQTLIVSNAPSRRTSGDVPNSDPAQWSSSYSASSGGSDVVRLSGRRYRLPVAFDTDAAAVFGCPVCHGVLGVGAGSPIWLVWPRATFSAGSVTLGRKQPQVAGTGRARIACDPLADDLCVSRAEVYGTEYDVRFQFRSPFTEVPGAVFDAYVGTRSVSNTPVGNWPSLKLRFLSADAPVDPRRPTLKIAPESLIGDSRHGGARTLLLRRSADPLSTEIVLGRTAWRSLILYREFSSGHAIVQTFDSSKRFPTWSLVVAVVTALAMARWWSTRDALFYESILGRFSDTRVAAIARRLKRRTGFGIPGEYGGGEKTFVETWYNQGSKRIGAAVSKWGWEGGLSGPYTTLYPGEWGVYPDRLLIELVGIPGAIATLYIPALRRSAQSKAEFWVYLQVITYAMVVWIAAVWFSRLMGRADAFGVLRYFVASSSTKTTTTRSRKAQRRSGGASFVVYRAGLIRQAAVDILLSVIVLMISTLTRTDSLGTTMIALAAGILSGVTLYHFMASIVHMLRFEYRYPVGHRGEGVWVIWIIFTGLVALTTAVFCSIFVLVPFMQLHVTSANTGDFLLMAAVVYIFGIFLAFVMVDYEADRMELWIRKQRGKGPRLVGAASMQRLARQAS